MFSYRSLEDRDCSRSSAAVDARWGPGFTARSASQGRVGSLAVVVAQPGGELLESLVRGAIGPLVGLLAQQRLDEALGASTPPAAGARSGRRPAWASAARAARAHVASARSPPSSAASRAARRSTHPSAGVVAVARCDRSAADPCGAGSVALGSSDPRAPRAPLCALASPSDSRCER